MSHIISHSYSSSDRRNQKSSRSGFNLPTLLLCGDRPLHQQAPLQLVQHLYGILVCQKISNWFKSLHLQSMLFSTSATYPVCARVGVSVSSSTSSNEGNESSHLTCSRLALTFVFAEFFLFFFFIFLTTQTQTRIQSYTLQRHSPQTRKNSVCVQFITSATACTDRR